MNACMRCLGGCAASAAHKSCCSNNSRAFAAAAAGGGSNSTASSSSSSAASAAATAAAAAASAAAAAPFKYSPLLQIPKTPPNTKFRRLDELSKGIRSKYYEGLGEIIHIPNNIIINIVKEGFININHLLRSSHLIQLNNIINDKQSTQNDKVVALELIKNACIAAEGKLPGCQDTGTAIIVGKKGQNVFIEEKEDIEESIYKGVYLAYTQGNLRYSQMAPLDMYTEVNTKCNLPCQVDISSCNGSSLEFLFIAKGGGSANKTFLYQQTKALLIEDKLIDFLLDKIKEIGTSACPPYHLAIVIGGLSAEQNIKILKLSSCHYYDYLPNKGNQLGIAFRDLYLEQLLIQRIYQLGIGAQFGGKYFCHDVRVIRLPRHAASLPIGIGVSCSADRQVQAYINKDGVFMEELERDPSKYLPDIREEDLGLGEAIRLDINRPIKEIINNIKELSIKTRVSLYGYLIVARDIAHAKLLDKLNKEGDLPDYFKEHPIYYAGPAKTPEGMISGSFGPTTAGRMDSYIPLFMSKGASLITIAKGNRSKQVAHACKQYGGVYLGAIGGPAARIAQHCIKEVQIIDYPELGMEAIWKIRVEDFPAFVVIDAKGNDFYSTWTP